MLFSKLAKATTSSPSSQGCSSPKSDKRLPSSANKRATLEIFETFRHSENGKDFGSGPTEAEIEAMLD